MNISIETAIDLVGNSEKEIHFNTKQYLEKIPKDQKEGWLSGWREAHLQMKRVFAAEKELNG